MRNAVLPLLRLIKRLGVGMLVPVFAALILYQAPGIEAGTGLAVSGHSVALIASSTQVLSEKPAAPEARGRPLPATPIAEAGLPAAPFGSRPLRLTFRPVPVVQMPRQAWQARAPPLFPAHTIT